MTEPQPPVDMAALTALEKQVGALLPEDYRRFVMMHNGGWSHDYRMTYQDAQFESQTLSVYRWLPIGRTRKQTGIPGIEEVLEHMGDGVPTTTVPIAADDSGDPIILVVNPVEYGAVYFLNSQASPERSLSRLAASFSDFLRGLALTRRRS